MSTKGDLHPPSPASRPHRIRWHLHRSVLRTRGQACHEVFAALALLLALALPALGFLAARMQLDHAEAHQRTVAAAIHPVPAVLQQNVYAVGGPWSGSDSVKATVTWTAADGTPHTGLADVRSVGHTGQPTTIWLDRAGQPAAPPSPHERLVVDAVGFGLATTFIGAGLLVALAAAESKLFMRLRKAAWARDWARTAPNWTRAA